MSLGLYLGLTVGNPALNTGGDDGIPPGSVQLLVETNNLDNATYWNGMNLAAVGPYTGPQGAENAWELICGGGDDPIFTQAPLPPVSLAGRSLRLRVWAMSGNLEGYLPAFKWFSYLQLFEAGIDQIQAQEQAITAAWARYEFDVSFASWSSGDQVAWRIDPYDAAGGASAPAPGASIYIAKPELWLLPA